MSIQLYNTMSRQLEPLVTRDKGKVAIYVCGVTPYDYPHIGNARAVVAFDTIRRYLEYRGYKVLYVQNFTDIDDKIINSAQQQQLPWQAIAERFIAVYYEEMDALNVKRADFYPMATDNIDEMILLISKLFDEGLAYAADGDVYFEVRKFLPYGKLSGRNLDDMRSGARVEVNNKKRDPLDFTLWKSARPDEPQWNSPWGPGRPGWNLECSAMSYKYLGEAFDIHGGGQDLIFPHHENEIAQSEGAMGCGSTFARYWLHNGFVTVNQEKMSKSLGNFFKVREVLKRYSPQVLRYFLTSAHYRSPIDFSDHTLDQAKAAYERLRLGLLNISRVLSSPPIAVMASETPAALRAICKQAENNFQQAMDEDFQTPRALAVLFDLIGETNRVTGDAAFIAGEETRKLLSVAHELTLRLAAVLGIELAPQQTEPDTLAPQLMDILIALRAQARKDKQYALSDAIRDRLNDIGIVLEDTPQGTSWRKN